jgi:hypothetical protein
VSMIYSLKKILVCTPYLLHTELKRWVGASLRTRKKSEGKFSSPPVKPCTTTSSCRFFDPIFRWLTLGRSGGGDINWLDRLCLGNVCEQKGPISTTWAPSSQKVIRDQSRKTATWPREVPRPWGGRVGALSIQRHSTQRHQYSAASTERHVNSPPLQLSTKVNSAPFFSSRWLSIFWTTTEPLLATDYRYESRGDPLSCFTRTNFWFRTRNHEQYKKF